MTSCISSDAFHRKTLMWNKTFDDPILDGPSKSTLNECPLETLKPKGPKMTWIIAFQKVSS